MKMKYALAFFASLLISSMSWSGSYVTTMNSPFFSNPEKTTLFVSTATSSGKGTVVLLHGFIMINPEIYMRLIDDLTGSGYDVIFPQFQEAGLGLPISLGLLDLIGFDGTSVNHDDWTDSACNGIRWALNTNMLYARNLVTWINRKPSSRLFVFGHSIGGPIGYNLKNRCSDVGSKIQGMVLANAVLDPSAMMAGQGAPIPVPTPQTINVAQAGALNTFPILFLTGQYDAWATVSQGQAFLNAAPNSPNKRIMVAQGSQADHMAPATDGGIISPSLQLLGVSSTIGGPIVHTDIDKFYYRGAILHLLNGGMPSNFTTSFPAL